MDDNYATKNASPLLVEEVIRSIQSVNYGSVEIYIQNGKVTQISVRQIKKTSIAPVNGNEKSEDGSFKNFHT
jgi:hypothetical protein